MPLYDYQCNNCDLIFEVLLGIDDPAPECPDCTCNQVTRLLGKIAVHIGEDHTAVRVTKEIKNRLARGQAHEALNLATKAEKLAGSKKGMGQIRAVRDKLSRHLGK